LFAATRFRSIFGKFNLRHFDFVLFVTRFNKTSRENSARALTGENFGQGRSSAVVVVENRKKRKFCVETLRREEKAFEIHGRVFLEVFLR